MMRNRLNQLLVVVLASLSLTANPVAGDSPPAQTPTTKDVVPTPASDVAVTLLAMSDNLISVKGLSGTATFVIEANGAQLPPVQMPVNVNPNDGVDAKATFQVRGEEFTWQFRLTDKDGVELVNLAGLASLKDGESRITSIQKLPGAGDPKLQIKDASQPVIEMTMGLFEMTMDCQLALDRQPASPKWSAIFEIDRLGNGTYDTTRAKDAIVIGNSVSANSGKVVANGENVGFKVSFLDNGQTDGTLAGVAHFTGNSMSDGSGSPGAGSSINCDPVGGDNHAVRQMILPHVKEGISDSEEGRRGIGITIHKVGPTPTAAVTSPTPTAITTPLVPLAGTGSLKVNVMDQVGKEVQGATISVQKDQDSLAAVGNSNGEVQLPIMSAGEWRMVVSAQGYQPDVQTVAIRANAPTLRSVVLKNAPALPSKISVVPKALGLAIAAAAVVLGLVLLRGVFLKRNA